jgi:hypothetical protein
VSGRTVIFRKSCLEFYVVLGVYSQLGLVLVFSVSFHESAGVFLFHVCQLGVKIGEIVQSDEMSN